MTTDERKVLRKLRKDLNALSNTIQMCCGQISGLLRGVTVEPSPSRRKAVEGTLKGQTCGTCRFYRYDPPAAGVERLMWCNYKQRKIYNSISFDSPACDFWEPRLPQPEKDTPSPQVSDEQWAEDLAQALVHKIVPYTTRSHDEIPAMILKALQTRKVEP